MSISVHSERQHSCLMKAWRLARLGVRAVVSDTFGLFLLKVAVLVLVTVGLVSMRAKSAQRVRRRVLLDELFNDLDLMQL